MQNVYSDAYCIQFKRFRVIVYSRRFVICNLKGQVKFTIKKSKNQKIKKSKNQKIKKSNNQKIKKSKNQFFKIA